MKIVIAGSGEVGSHLAKLLSAEEQDICLVDEDSRKLAVLDANYTSAREFTFGRNAAEGFRIYKPSLPCIGDQAQP